MPKVLSSLTHGQIKEVTIGRNPKTVNIIVLSNYRGALVLSR
jgi:hypothetical protein